MLVVDDREIILFAMRNYFGSIGYDVDTASTMDEANRLITLKSYSLAIVDLQLGRSPNTDGMKIVASLREKEPSSRIIMLTAYGTPQIVKEAQLCGVDVFLHKPVPLQKLAQLAGALLGKERGL